MGTKKQLDQPITLEHFHNFQFDMEESRDAEPSNLSSTLALDRIVYHQSSREVLYWMYVLSRCHYINSKTRTIRRRRSASVCHTEPNRFKLGAELREAPFISPSEATRNASIPSERSPVTESWMESVCWRRSSLMLWWSRVFDDVGLRTVRSVVVFRRWLPKCEFTCSYESENDEPTTENDW